MKKQMIIAVLILLVSASCTKQQTTNPSTVPTPSKGKWCYTCWQLDNNYQKILTTEDSFCDSAKYNNYISNKSKPYYGCRKD